jgi:hypothetical protein
LQLTTTNDREGGRRMTYGNTTVGCTECGKQRTMYGYLPMARQIWALDEGLLCCGVQTQIVHQEEVKKE